MWCILRKPLGVLLGLTLTIGGFAVWAWLTHVFWLGFGAYGDGNDSAEHAGKKLLRLVLLIAAGLVVAGIAKALQRFEPWFEETFFD